MDKMSQAEYIQAVLNLLKVLSDDEISSDKKEKLIDIWENAEYISRTSKNLLSTDI